MPCVRFHIPYHALKLKYPIKCTLVNTIYNNTNIVICHHYQLQDVSLINLLGTLHLVDSTRCNLFRTECNVGICFLCPADTLRWNALSRNVPRLLKIETLIIMKTHVWPQVVNKSGADIKVFLHQWIYRTILVLSKKKSWTFHLKFFSKCRRLTL